MSSAVGVCDGCDHAPGSGSGNRHIDVRELGSQVGDAQVVAPDYLTPVGLGGARFVGVMPAGVGPAAAVSRRVIGLWVMKTTRCCRCASRPRGSRRARGRRRRRRPIDVLAGAECAEP